MLGLDYLRYTENVSQFISGHNIKGCRQFYYTYLDFFIFFLSVGVVTVFCPFMAAQINSCESLRVQMFKCTSEKNKRQLSGKSFKVKLNEKNSNTPKLSLDKKYQNFGHVSKNVFCYRQLLFIFFHT